MQKFSNFDFQDLHPALAGYLIDKKIDHKEIVATIVDLIQKGYLSFSHNTLFLENFDDNLLLYEKEILERLFTFGKTNKSFDLINALDCQSIIPFIKLDFVKLGLANYDKNFNVNFLIEEEEDKNIFSTKFKNLIIFFIISVIFFVFFAILMFFPNLFAFFIFWSSYILISFLFVFFLILFLFAIRDSIDSLTGASDDLNKFLINPVLSKMKKQCVELFNFIKINEYSDLNLSREFLPYTICFGHNKIWTKKFEQIRTHSNIHLKKTYQTIDKVSTFSSFSVGGVVISSDCFESKNFKLNFIPDQVSEKIYNIKININHKNSKKESNVALIKNIDFFGGELIFDRLITKFNFNGFKKIKDDFYFKGNKLIYDDRLLHDGVNPLISLNLIGPNGKQLKLYQKFSEDELIILLSIFYNNLIDLF
jgi:hypothetical protein